MTIEDGYFLNELRLRSKLQLQIRLNLTILSCRTQRSFERRFFVDRAVEKGSTKAESEASSLSNLLHDFDEELKQKRFSFASDEETVRSLMIKLINQFTDDWKGEVEKQKTMSKRAREILLRWGCFSEHYVETAELLCDRNDDRKRAWWYLPGVALIVAFLAPVIGALHVTFALEGDDVIRRETSALYTRVFGMEVCAVFYSILLLHVMNFAFAKIPLGSHTLKTIIIVGMLCCCISFSLRFFFVR